MSELYDSLHYYGRPDEVRALLREGRGGALVAWNDTWTTFVPAVSVDEEPDAALYDTAQSIGALVLSLDYGSDHGLWIELHEGTRSLGRLSLDWEAAAAPRVEGPLYATLAARGILAFARVQALRSFVGSLDLVAIDDYADEAPAPQGQAPRGAEAVLRRTAELLQLPAAVGVSTQAYAALGLAGLSGYAQAEPVAAAATPG